MLQLLKKSSPKRTKGVDVRFRIGFNTRVRDVHYGKKQGKLVTPNQAGQAFKIIELHLLIITVSQVTVQ